MEGELRFTWPENTEVLVCLGDTVWTGHVLARYEDAEGVHDVRYPGSAKAPTPVGKVVKSSPTGLTVRWLAADDAPDRA